MSVISGTTTKTLPNLEAISKISDNDLIYVELAQGGSRKMTYADLLSNISIGGAMAREQQCINGSRAKGIEWDVDELMTLVRNGDFDKFAIGDYITDSETSIEFAIAAKNFYPVQAFNQSRPEFNHIVLMPFTALATKHPFNHNYNTNSGGYAGSDMSSVLEMEIQKLSLKIRNYCTLPQTLENNKGAWDTDHGGHSMRLPTVMEVTGDRGWASTEGFSSGVSGQLPLCKSTWFRVLKDDWYWLLDPSSFDTTDFCNISSNGSSNHTSATTVGSIRPLLVMI